MLGLIKAFLILLPWLPPDPSMPIPSQFHLCEIENNIKLVGVWTQDPKEDYASFEHQQVKHAFLISKEESLCDFAEAIIYEAEFYREDHYKYD